MTFLCAQPPLLSSCTPKRLTVGISSFCSLLGRRHWRGQRGSGILTADCGLQGTCAYFCLLSRCPASPDGTGLLLCLPRKKLELREVKPFFEKEKKKKKMALDFKTRSAWLSDRKWILFLVHHAASPENYRHLQTTYVFVTSLLFPLSQGSDS